MLNDNEIEPNAFKVYVVVYKKGSKQIAAINLVGVFEDAGYAINYCNYYLDKVYYYVVDPKGNVIY